MKEKIDVVILCGGKGERLKDITNGNLAKPLVKISGKELIQHSLDLLKDSRINKLIFAVDSYGKQIISYLQHRELLYTHELSYQKKEGILDAILCAAQKGNSNTLLILNADEIRVDLNISKLLDSHFKNKHLATIASTQANNLYRHRVLEISDKDLVTSTSLKDKKYLDDTFKTGLVNIGCTVLSKKLLFDISGSYNSGWNELINFLVDNRLLFAYVDKKVIYFNVGTIEEFTEANAYLSAINSPTNIKKVIETASLDQV